MRAESWIMHLYCDTEGCTARLELSEDSKHAAHTKAQRRGWQVGK